MDIVTFVLFVGGIGLLVAGAEAGEGDIAVGNVVGSNISNFLTVLGLVLNASQHSALPMLFSTIMVAFVIPLTALTFLILVVRGLRSGLRKRQGVLLCSAQRDRDHGE